MFTHFIFVVDTLFIFVVVTLSISIEVPGSFAEISPRKIRENNWAKTNFIAKHVESHRETLTH